VRNIRHGKNIRKDKEDEVECQYRGATIKEGLLMSWRNTGKKRARGPQRWDKKIYSIKKIKLS
jgi:hypothetical protein